MRTGSKVFGAPATFFHFLYDELKSFFFFLQAQKILLERRALTLVVKKTNQFKPRKRLYKTLLRKLQGWISLSSKKNSLTTSTSIFATKKKSVERKSRKGGWENGEYSWTWENRTQTVEQYSTNLAVESKPRTASTESGKRRWIFARGRGPWATICQPPFLELRSTEKIFLQTCLYL